MPTEVCPQTDQLRSLTNGTLVDDQSDALFGHVENCSRCLHELEQLERQADTSDSVIQVLRSGSETPFDREGQCELAVSKARNVIRHREQHAEPADNLVKSTIGDYEVIRLLGHGGMGSVYLATHQKLARQVALKVLARHRLFDPHMQARFEQEMRAIGALSHPNIVTAFDAREIDGTTVLITEYIDGLDLGKVINRVGHLNMADACQVALVVAQVLAYTDQRGFVHRDIKPSNIMLSAHGVVKVLDLGLARLDMAGTNHPELTATGQALGSPDYVAPEQIVDSRSVDARTDLYSLGCTLFKMLSGRNVFEGQQFATPFAKMTAHVNSAPPSLSTVVPSADSRLVRLVDSMLHKDPNQRPGSAAEVVEALSPFTARSNLAALIERALRLPEVPAPTNSADALPQPSPHVETQPDWNRNVPVNLAIAAGLFGMMVGLFFGIVITITNRDGTQTKIHVPDGSAIQIDTGEGLAGTPPAPSVVPKPSDEKANESKSDPKAGTASRGFLADNGVKPLPTLTNVKLFATNRPDKISLTPVELPVVEPGDVFVSTLQSNSRVSPILLLDSKTKTVALSASVTPSYGAKNERSQIFVGQLPLGPFKEIFSIDRSFTLLDYDVRTGQSLGVLGEDGMSGDRELVLFNGLFEGKLQEISRQRLPLRRDQTVVLNQAKLVAENHAVVFLNGAAYCWDLVEGTEVYQTDPNRHFQSKLCFSPDRTVMTMVDNMGVHFVNTKTGDGLGFIRFESQVPCIAPFDTNSNRIALCAEDAWSTYDFEKSILTKPQTATWSLGSRLLGWIGKDLFLCENGVVIHTERQVPIWKYHSQSLAVSSRTCEFALWKDSISVVESSGSLRIRTLAMPSSEMQAALSTMPDPEKMMLTGPGTKASIELKLPDPLPKDVDPEKLKSRMVEIMKFSEWEYDQESKLKLVIQMAPGKPYTTQHVTYEKMENNLNFPNNMRPIQTPVEITPMISTLELRDGDELVWYFDSRGMIMRRPNWGMYGPPSPNVKQPTKEEFIESQQQANSQFFYGVFLPTRIARPPYTHGLGANKESDGTWVPAKVFE